MAVEYGTDSNYAKEMRRHEAYPTKFGPPGRPFVHHEFPKMLYRAERVSGKGIVIVDKQIAQDAHEERNLQSRGFYFGPDKAVEAIQLEQTEHGKLAAEREYAIQHGKHSEQAVSEIRAAEAEAGAVHLPNVPETPIKKRGRKVAVPA